MKAKVRFEVLENGTWMLVSKAKQVSNGWLHWEKHTKNEKRLGLARPGDWRAKEITKEKK